MIAEIVSNGLLTLPNAMAVVGAPVSQLSRIALLICAQTPNAGIIPSLVLTIFLGVFALFTAKLLVDFKLNHPEVHNMGKYLSQCARNELRSHVTTFRRCGLYHVRVHRSGNLLHRFWHLRCLRCGSVPALMMFQRATNDPICFLGCSAPVRTANTQCTFR